MLLSIKQEWEVIEKRQPDGRKVRVRRRKVHVIQVVKEPEDLVNENEVIVEEMPLDQNIPDDDGEKFDPEVNHFSFSYLDGVFYYYSFGILKEFVAFLVLNQRPFVNIIDQTNPK